MILVCHHLIRGRFPHSQTFHMKSNFRQQKHFEWFLSLGIFGLCARATTIERTNEWKNEPKRALNNGKLESNNSICFRFRFIDVIEIKIIISRIEKRTDWIRFGAVAVTAAALRQVTRDIFEHSDRPHNERTNKQTNVFHPFDFIAKMYKSECEVLHAHVCVCVCAHLRPYIRIQCTGIITFAL